MPQGRATPLGPAEAAGGSTGTGVRLVRGGPLAGEALGFGVRSTVS